MAAQGADQHAESISPGGEPPLRLGITTPVLTLLPGGHATWEVDSEYRGGGHRGPGRRLPRVLPPDLQRARGHPDRRGRARGSRYWDPLATFGYLAAVTSRMRLATNVLVLGYHHPLEIAKRYGTLDQVSGGRLILGLGRRLPRGGVRTPGGALRRPGGPGRRRHQGSALFALDQRPAYDGPYYRYADLVMDPCAQQARVPAVDRGTDGPVPAAGRRAGGRLGALRHPGRRRGHHDVEGPGHPGMGGPHGPARGGAAERPAPRPVGDPEGARTVMGKLAAAGATGVQLGFVHHSLAHYLEQLEAMAQLIGGR